MSGGWRLGRMHGGYHTSLASFPLASSEIAASWRSYALVQSSCSHEAPLEFLACDLLHCIHVAQASQRFQCRVSGIPMTRGRNTWSRTGRSCKTSLISGGLHTVTGCSGHPLNSTPYRYRSIVRCHSTALKWNECLSPNSASHWRTFAIPFNDAREVCRIRLRVRRSCQGGMAMVVCCLALHLLSRGVTQRCSDICKAMKENRLRS